MQFFCSRCEKPVTPEETEAVDGFLYSCPDCNGPIAFVTYGELSVEQPASAAPPFAEVERQYLTDIIDRQLVKLHGAAHRLMSIKDKIGSAA